MHRAFAAAVLTGVVLVLASCTPTAAPAAPVSPATSPVALDTLQTDVRTAVTAVETFWQRHYPELFGRPYVSPRVAGGYTGTGGPACAGEPSTPNNAFYCQPGDFLAWDQNLMAAGYSRIGDAWVYLIIAHEWGHAIQARLSRDQVSVAAELQADCLAGATLAGAAQDGLIRIEPGDSEEIARTLTAVADDFPWTMESDHGNAQQRIDAFNTGARGGVPACI